MPSRVIHPTMYLPTVPRSGDTPDEAIYSMENFILRGQGGLKYGHCYGGSFDLNETIPTVDLTGTIDISEASLTVSGTSTSFTTELHLGQYVLVVGTGEAALLTVESIVSDTSFITSTLPTFTDTGLTGSRLPIVFSVDIQRGTALRGAVIRLDKGTLISVGDGTFLLDGSPISASLSLTRQPQISLFASGVAAVASLTVVTNPNPADTLVVGGATYTFVAAAPGAGDILIQATESDTAIAIAAQISIDVASTLSTAEASGQIVNLTAAAVGAAGNAITLTPDGVRITSVAFHGGVDAGSGYQSFPLGMATPSPPSLSAVGGGSPGMEAGDYSIVITPARKETDGYNNPSSRADVTVTTGDRVEITFPAMDTANGQNAWIWWGTTYSASLGADKNYLEGPWFKGGLIDDTQVSPAGGTYIVEWLDAQIERNDLVTFDNDAPTDAEFVVNFNNVPVYISCQGIPNEAGTTTSPGPFIVPAKPNNIEAAPLTLAFSSSPPEIIYGVVSGSGRLYLLTSNHLQIAQGTPQPDTPVLIQPFWKSGFKNPYQVVFINEHLYGFPVSGPTRSMSFGAEGSEDTNFAADVQSITDTWIPCRVTVGVDPKNYAVCFFHAADSLNTDGFWTTRVLMFGLQQDKWIGDITLTSSTQDMIVSSVATVGQDLVFLAGGRQDDDFVEVNTYIFDQDAGTSVPWRLAAPFSDTGDELRGHIVKRVRATTKCTDASLGVFGFQPTEAIDSSALVAGNGASLTGAISLPDSNDVTLTQQFQTNCPNLDVSTVQIQGTWDGSGDRDRVDEIVMEFAPQGVRR